MEIENMKLCKICNIEKSIIEYYKDKKNKDKLKNYCKSCWNLVTGKDYKKNYNYIIKDKLECIYCNRLCKSQYHLNIHLKGTHYIEV